jgi:hypothetical protein
MVKRIPCKVVSSVFSGCHQTNGSQPPMRPGDSSGTLGEVNADDDNISFPMGMFIDIVIGDN